MTFSADTWTVAQAVLFAAAVGIAIEALAAWTYAQWRQRNTLRDTRRDERRSMRGREK